MKKRIAIFLCLIISIVCCLAFGGCDIGRRYDNEGVVDNVVLLRNKLYKKSLAAYCEWDGDENNKEFTVPDEYCGYKVKCLGAKGNPGFTGNPGSFCVHIPDKLEGYEKIVGYAFLPSTATAENTVEFQFTINIGKNVNQLEQISIGRIYGYGFNNDGIQDIKEYVVLKFYYVIDSGNSTFYSKDGDIYYKSNDKMIEYRF